MSFSVSDAWQNNFIMGHNLILLDGSALYVLFEMETKWVLRREIWEQ